jgi:ribA/ribD-fused uncharacterized protein
MNLIIEDLLKTESYKKDSSAWFYSSRDPRYELSNMSRLSLIHRGIEWRTSEHLYQASKYSSTVKCAEEKDRNNPTIMTNVRARIFMAHNGMAAKITQKCAVEAGLVRDDWQDQNITNMHYVLALKLACNYEVLNDILERTEDKDIVEISKKDSFWGCRTVYHPNGVRLVGQNVLGKLWMNIRDRKEEFKNHLEIIEPKKFFI